MKCEICNLEKNQEELFRGISEEEVINVCKECADLEKIPLIKSPSNEQLKEAERRPSVRERMEKLSGLKDKPGLTQTQMAASKQLAKLRVPEKKQYDPELVDNYDWLIRMARRRKKLSISQLANQTGISQEMIDDLERGQLNGDYLNAAAKIELFLDIKLLQNHEKRIMFTRNKGDEEKKILEEVRQKMHAPEKNKEETIKQRSEKINKIARGELDFSKQENIQDIKLRDLVQMKKKREQEQQKSQSKKQHEEMFGEDVELEIEEV